MRSFLSFKTGCVCVAEHRPEKHQLRPQCAARCRVGHPFFLLCVIKIFLPKCRMDRFVVVYLIYFHCQQRSADATQSHPFPIMVKLEPAAVFRGSVGQMSTASNAEGMSRFPVLPPIKCKSPEPDEVAASREILENHRKRYQELRKHSRKNVERQQLQMSLYDFLFCACDKFLFH